MPDLSSLAGLMGGLGGGGGGGGGGMPDLSAMMNNPALMSMAESMMANGGLERLMSNPAMANIVRACSFPLNDGPLCLFASGNRQIECRAVVGCPICPN